MKENMTVNKLVEIKENNIPKITKSFDSYPLIIDKKIISNNVRFNRNPIPRNIFFNINGRDFNVSNEKDTKSYVYLNSERKKIKLSNLQLKFDKKYINKSQYYLPILMEKRLDKTKLKLYLNDLNFMNKKKGTLKQGSLANTKNEEKKLNKNFKLCLNTISNDSQTKYKILKSKKINFNTTNISNEKENTKIDNYLEKIKNYRKTLKDQMINRYKVNYSQHKKCMTEKYSKNENNQFVYNYDDKSINNINKNVDNAINIFYEKIQNRKINGYEKNYINFSNEYIESHILKDKVNKLLNTINII